MTTRTSYRAILIDAIDRKVSEVMVAGGIDAIYEALRCETFDYVGLDSETGDGMYVDDEGLLKVEAATEPYACFYWRNDGGEIFEFAGNGLVVGTDGEGETVPPKLTLAKVRERVRFGHIDAGRPCPMPVVTFFKDEED